VVGRGWPTGAVRLEMLEEAIGILKRLWRGGLTNHRGRYYTVRNAQLFSLPDDPPELMIASSKAAAAALAAREGDANIHTHIDAGLVKRFRSAGGEDKPRYVELTVCWAETEERARRTAREVWSLAALSESLFAELELPAHFEAAFAPIGEDLVAQNVVCGPDPEAHLAKIREAEEAGYTHACVHQVGPEQGGFFRFYEEEVLPRLSSDRDRPRQRPSRASARTVAMRGRRGAKHQRAKQAARRAR
jgi:G6PDH family F420-dependent oxidoreductase